jgi:hypothetical protein
MKVIATVIFQAIGMAAESYAQSPYGFGEPERNGFYDKEKLMIERFGEQ